MPARAPRRQRRHARETSSRRFLRRRRPTHLFHRLPTTRARACCACARLGSVPVWLAASDAGARACAPPPRAARAPFVIRQRLRVERQRPRTPGGPRRRPLRRLKALAIQNFERRREQAGDVQTAGTHSSGDPIDARARFNKWRAVPQPARRAAGGVPASVSSRTPGAAAPGWQLGEPDAASRARGPPPRSLPPGAGPPSSRARGRATPRRPPSAGAVRSSFTEAPQPPRRGRRTAGPASSSAVVRPRARPRARGRRRRRRQTPEQVPRAPAPRRPRRARRARGGASTRPKPDQPAGGDSRGASRRVARGARARVRARLQQGNARGVRAEAFARIAASLDAVRRRRARARVARLCLRRARRGAPPPPRGAPGSRRRARRSTARAALGCRVPSPSPGLPGCPLATPPRAPHEGSSAEPSPPAGLRALWPATARPRRSQEAAAGPRRPATLKNATSAPPKPDSSSNSVASSSARPRALHELVLRGARAGLAAPKSRAAGLTRVPYGVPERCPAAGEERVARGRVRSAIGVFPRPTRKPPSAGSAPPPPPPATGSPPQGRSPAFETTTTTTPCSRPLRASAAPGEDVVVAPTPRRAWTVCVYRKPRRAVPAGSVSGRDARPAAGRGASNDDGRARRSAPNSEREGHRTHRGFRNERHPVFFLDHPRDAQEPPIGVTAKTLPSFFVFAVFFKRRRRRRTAARRRPGEPAA